MLEMILPLNILFDIYHTYSSLHVYVWIVTIVYILIKDQYGILSLELEIYISFDLREAWARYPCNGPFLGVPHLCPQYLKLQ